MSKKMTTEEILNIDINDIQRMNRKELAEITSILSSTANKRIKRLEKHENDLRGQALSNLKNYGDVNFSVKGKNINQLRNEFKKVSSFLRNESSTVTGIKNIQKRLFDRLDVKPRSQDDIDTIWKAYNRLMELRPAEIYKKASTQLQQYLFSQENTDIDSLLENAQNYLDELYLEEQSDEIIDEWIDI